MEIDRYKYHGNIFKGEAGMYKDPDGEWVKWADLVVVLSPLFERGAALQRALDRICKEDQEDKDEKESLAPLVDQLFKFIHPGY
jgi:hypothetical protein